MSLIEFVKRPAIKDAFVAYGTRDRTPDSLRRAPLRVPSCGKLHAHAGTAFDYLARFHVANSARSSAATVHDRSWAAENGLARLEAVRVPAREAAFWRESVEAARAEVRTYIAGSGDTKRLAYVAQILANAEVLARNPHQFDATFRPLPELSAELLALLELFVAQETFKPVQSCVMNPAFGASHRIEGGDGDLVIDQRLIDFKTTLQPKVDQRDMLQVAGYAALQRMGGTLLDDNVHLDEFESVGLYFSRFGVLAEWSISALFPNGGFDHFCRVFEAEVDQDG